MDSNIHPAGQRALRRGRISLAHQTYHVTVSTAGRASWFENGEAAHQVARCLEDRQLLGDATTLAWVLMPDHIHWLCQLGGDDTLPVVVARMKSVTARKANAALGRNGPRWQKGYHERAIRCQEDVRQVARYIVANPIRGGLVVELGAYPYWNCIWL